MRTQAIKIFTLGGEGGNLRQSSVTKYILWRFLFLGQKNNNYKIERVVAEQNSTGLLQAAQKSPCLVKRARTLLLILNILLIKMRHKAGKPVLSTAVFFDHFFYTTQSQQLGKLNTPYQFLAGRKQFHMACSQLEPENQNYSSASACRLQSPGISTRHLYYYYSTTWQVLNTSNVR